MIDRRTPRASATALSAVALSLTIGPAFAATVTNQDGDAHMLIVTERGIKAEVVIAAGETIAFCPAGCFVTAPNGDRAVLRGGETVDLIAGALVIN